jgi:hypothetical protein
MSHHGREYEDDNRCGSACSENFSKVQSAVALIAAIAKEGGDRSRSGGPAPHVLCDRWLEANGYDCEASRKRRREQRAIQLDAEIAKLQQERALLK